MIRSSNKAFLIASVASLSFAAPAWADVTAEEIGNRLGRLMASEAVALHWDAIDGSGNDFILRGARAEAKDGGVPAVIGDITLRNVTEIDGGDYRVDEMEIPSFSISRAGLTVVMTGALMEGLLLAGPNSTDPLAGKMISESARINEMSASSGGSELFSMSNFSYQIERSNDGWDMTYTGAAEKFSSDLSKIEDPQAAAMLAALQIQQISGSMETAGSWSLKTGKAGLDKFDITFDNRGKIGLTTSMDGYTQAFMKATDEARAAAANGTPEQAQAQGLALLGLQQQITISSASLRYDDASFAMRALEMAAATQNARASDLPGTAQMMLPMLLPQYLPPDMVQQVTAELVKFLREPKNIEVSIAPAEPVALFVLSAGMGDPKATAAALGLKVVANQ